MGLRLFHGVVALICGDRACSAEGVGRGSVGAARILFRVRGGAALWRGARRVRVDVLGGAARAVRKTACLETGLCY